MMPRLSFAAVVVALAPWLWPANAAAQVGIAYVGAPERSSATCTAGNPDRAFECARERCAVRGVRPSECMRLAWCFPAGWSVLVFKQHRDGFHGHVFTCGLQSREMALKVAALQCDRAGQPELQECAATELYGPDGLPHKP